MGFLILKSYHLFPYIKFFFFKCPSILKYLHILRDFSLPPTIYKMSLLYDNDEEEAINLRNKNGRNIIVNRLEYNIPLVKKATDVIFSD